MNAGAIFDEELQQVYGIESDLIDQIPDLGKRDTFLPWHHPVKQIVRRHQWAAQAERLLKLRTNERDKILRYFTLPGTDLLDVKVLGEVCSKYDHKVEYFGFDASADGEDEATSSIRIQTEATLRQSGIISEDALIYPDRLEDIAVARSQADSVLKRQLPFDIINVDACDNLAYAPAGREKTTFDAITRLLKHQLARTDAWQLWITTRADPALLGPPGTAFQSAIAKNLDFSPEFGEALADAMGAERAKIATELNSIWVTAGNEFLKLFVIGLGKHLLQFFHQQPNTPQRVELASAYAYRVHGESPDMLAIAFRITPEQARVFPPGIGGAIAIPVLEPAQAVEVVAQATKLQDLDQALDEDKAIRDGAVSETEQLLYGAQYDLDAWRQWLKNHKVRPFVA